MSVDLPSGSEALRRLLGVGGTGPSLPGTGRSTPTPAPGPPHALHPTSQIAPQPHHHPTQPPDSTSMFGALFGAPDVFQTVRQNSGGTPHAAAAMGGIPIPIPVEVPSAPSSIMSGIISAPASRTDTPVDPALLDPAIVSSSSGPGGPLHHLHVSLKTGVGVGAAGLPQGPLAGRQGSNLPLHGGAAVRISGQQPLAVPMPAPPPAAGAEPFSFLELLQEQQQQEQQVQGVSGYGLQPGVTPQQGVGVYGVQQAYGVVQQQQLYGNGLHMQQDLTGMGQQGYGVQPGFGVQGTAYGAGGVGYGLKHLLPGAQH